MRLGFCEMLYPEERVPRWRQPAVVHQIPVHIVLRRTRPLVPLPETCRLSSGVLCLKLGEIRHPYMLVEPRPPALIIHVNVHVSEIFLKKLNLSKVLILNFQSTLDVWTIMLQTFLFFFASFFFLCLFSFVV